MYNNRDPFAVTEKERAEYQAFLATLTEQERALLNSGYYLYVVDVKNIGGLVMPLAFKLEYVDGTTEMVRVPAEIWRYNNFNVSKLIIAKKEAKAIILDPNYETADTDMSNNAFPRRPMVTRFPVIATHP
jgi:hypothetical protein